MGELAKVAQKVKEVYQKTRTLSASCFAICSPLRLKLAIVFCQFTSIYLENHQEAIDVANSTLAEALENIDDLDDKDFPEARDLSIRLSYMTKY